MMNYSQYDGTVIKFHGSKPPTRYVIIVFICIHHHFQWVNQLFLWPFSMSQTSGAKTAVKPWSDIGRTSQVRNSEELVKRAFFFVTGDVYIDKQKTALFTS